MVTKKGSLCVALAVAMVFRLPYALD